MRKNEEIKYDVKEKCGIISETAKATNEIRLVSFNDGDYKYDFRPWWEDKDGNEKMGKGVRYTKEELKAIKKIIDKILKEDK